MVLVLSHDDCLSHVAPAGHPECVDRLPAVRRGLAGLDLTFRDCPMGEIGDVLRAHPRAYAERVRDAVPAGGMAMLDGDTFLSPGSWNAAMRAVGGACAAVDAVLAGEVQRAFVACRPPGHHAETARAMGFCLFGTIAIAAKRALDHHGLSRVAIVDFDVHHGNGTQDILWHEARCLFVSSHQMPLYPGSGARDETGAHGQILNLPLRAGSDGAAMRAAYETQVFPRLEAWQPELLLISAGFDAHAADPLAGLNWRAEDFGWLTRELVKRSGGRVVSTLEGGYDLDALAESVAAHALALKDG
jgi:acetoin utilization deacetylase AcuC-like enzyme